jgi:hypothetical protein
MKKLTLKDFTVGQKAYILYTNSGRSEAPTITEVTVKKIGRKYVTVDSFDRQFMRWGNIEPLFEHDDWGERGYLFNDYKSAEIEKNRRLLEKDIRACMRFIDNCSYDEMLAIMDILRKASKRDNI